MKKPFKLLLSFVAIGVCLFVSSCADKTDETDKPNDGEIPTGDDYFTIELLGVNVYNEDATELLYELYDALHEEDPSLTYCELIVGSTYILDVYSQSDRELESQYTTYIVDSEYIHIDECPTYLKTGHSCFSITCDEPVEDVEVRFDYPKEQLPEHKRSFGTYTFTFISDSE